MKLPLLTIFVCLCLACYIQESSAASGFGYDNPSLPRINSPAATIVASGSGNGTSSVNDSQFLRGLTPQEVANLYIENDPIASRNLTLLAASQCPSNNFAVGIYLNGSFICQTSAASGNSTNANNSLSLISIPGDYFVHNFTVNKPWFMNSNSFRNVSLFQGASLNITDGNAANPNRIAGYTIFGAQTNHSGTAYFDADAVLNRISYIGTDGRIQFQSAVAPDTGDCDFFYDDDNMWLYLACRDGQSPFIIEGMSQIYLNAPVVTTAGITNGGGNIDVGGNSVINVIDVNATRFNGNGSRLTGVCLTNGSQCPPASGSLNISSQYFENISQGANFPANSRSITNLSSLNTSTMIVNIVQYLMRDAQLRWYNTARPTVGDIVMVYDPNTGQFLFDGQDSISSLIIQNFAQILMQGNVQINGQLDMASHDIIAVRDLNATNINGDGSGLSVQAGSSGTFVKNGGMLFDIYVDKGNVGTGETQLHAYTVPANMLNNNGSKIVSWYAISSVGSATATSQYKIYWNNITIYDGGALGFGVSTDTMLQLYLTRENSTALKSTVIASTTTASAIPYVRVVSTGSQSFTGSNVINVTATRAGVGAASNDILLRQGGGEWKPAA